MVKKVPYTIHDTIILYLIINHTCLVYLTSALTMKDKTSSVQQFEIYITLKFFFCNRNPNLNNSSLFLFCMYLVVV